MSRMKDMTTGDPLKQILFFAFPLLLMNLCNYLYQITNTYVVGNFLGKEALGAVGGASGSLHFLVFGFFFGLTGGLTVVTAQRFGAKDMVNVRRSIGTSFVITFIISTSLLLTAGFTIRPVLRMMNTPPELIENASAYMQILFFCGSAIVLHSMLNSILRALGDSKTPLYFSIYGNIANICMNLYLVYFKGVGVTGVAWATIFAQVTSFAGCVAYSLWKFPILRLKKEDFRMDWRFTWEHLRVALPMAFQFTVTSVGIVILQRAVNGYGSDAVGGISATSPIGTVTIAPLFTIGIAIATFVAQNYGARKLDRIREGVRKMVFVVFGFTALTSVLMYSFAPQLVKIFLKDNVDNAVALDYGVIHLQFQAMFYVILGQLFIFRNAQQGMGHASIPFWAGVAELVARVFGAIFLTAWFGFKGAAISHPLAWLFATILVAIDYWWTIRKLKKTGIPERIKTGKKTA